MITFEIEHRTGTVIVKIDGKKAGEIHAHIRSDSGRVAYVYWAKNNKNHTGLPYDSLCECKESLK